MTARLDNEQIATLRAVYTYTGVEHVPVICEELLRLRSLFTPETVAALEAGADFLQLQADRLRANCVLGTASIRSKQAAALRALASAVASTADGAANE